MEENKHEKTEKIWQILILFPVADESFLALM